MTDKHFKLRYKESATTYYVSLATGGGTNKQLKEVLVGELTQIAMLGSLAECGMILVPFPKSAPGSEVTGPRWGPYARSGGSRRSQLALQKQCSKGVVYMGQR